MTVVLAALGLALGLVGAPEAGEEQEPDEQTRAAWEAAGWGAEPEAQTEPEPEPEPDEDEDEDAPTEGPPEAGEDTQAAWEAAGWGTPTDAEAGPEPEPEASPASEPELLDEPDDRVKVGDVLGGSLRLTGAFLHFDDEPALFPNGDDALAVALGRVLVEADLGEHLHLSFNGFAQLSRSPGAGGLGGAFASAGNTASAYRTRYLSWTYWESGAVAGQLGVDRAALKLQTGPVQLDVGRFPITYAVAALFTTNDFFAPFSPTAINTIYKPGVDAIRLSAGIGPRASVDVAGVLGYDPDTDRPSWGRSAVLTRAAIVAAGFEWAVLGGKVSQRWVAGGSLQGAAGPLTLRSEFHVGVPDEEGDGWQPGEDRPIYGRVSAGPMITFAWQNASLMAEYMYASDGASAPPDYLQRAQEGFSDDLPYLGRHYVGLAGGLELIPILRLGLTMLVSGTDGSGLAGVALTYNVADESDLILGVFVPWGRGLRSFDPMTGSLELGSEFGLSPITAYLEARVFF